MTKKIDNKIKQIFISSGEQKVLNCLLNQAGWQTAKEIQKITALSKAAVHFALDKLFKLKIIKRDQKGKTYLYRINSSYPIISIIRQFKILNNLITCLSLIKKLIPLSQKIILFGSACRGENLPESDIDLLVVTHNIEEVKKIAGDRFLGKKIQIIAKTPIAFAQLEKKDPIFYREIELGIILWEREQPYDAE